MDFLISVLNILNCQMTTPRDYGWFHLLAIALSISVGVWLCVTHQAGDDRRVRRVVLIVAVLVAVLEIYKQAIYTFGVENGTVVGDYQWYAFP